MPNQRSRVPKLLIFSDDCDSIWVLMDRHGILLRGGDNVKPKKRIPDDSDAIRMLMDRRGTVIFLGGVMILRPWL